MTEMKLKTAKRNLLGALCVVMLMTGVAWAQSPQLSGVGAQSAGETTSSSSAPRKSRSREKKEKTSASMTDAEVQKCIAGKFASSEKLNPQGFNITVESGVAKLTGKAANAGSKGAATRIAQSCGARSVTNEITAPAIPRPAKKNEKKENKNG